MKSSAKISGWGGARNKEESLWLAPGDKQKLAVWEQKAGKLVGK